MLVWKTKNNMRRQNILFPNHLHPDLPKFLRKFHFPKGHANKEQQLKITDECLKSGCRKGEEEFEAYATVKKNKYVFVLLFPSIHSLLPKTGLCFPASLTTGGARLPLACEM